MHFVDEEHSVSNIFYGKNNSFNIRTERHDTTYVVILASRPADCNIPPLPRRLCRAGQLKIKNREIKFATG
jgi:hypothetical protein